MIQLHLHSHYSVLDGLGTVEQIVQKAVEHKAPAVAITDHASITAMPELLKEAEKAGIKGIVGCEFYVVDTAEKPPKGQKERRYHLNVLAKSWAGVESIMSQLSLANQQFYYRPRITFEQALDFHDCIVMTACSGGALWHDNYKAIFGKLADKYGSDLYLEIMPHNILIDDSGGQINMQRVVNERAIALSQQFGNKLVATNDAHYVNHEDAYTHEILLAIQSGKKWNDPKRWTFAGDGFYMRSVAEMVNAFRANCPYINDKIIGEAIAATLEIADKCDIKMPKFDVHLPSIHPDDDAAFTKFISEGWASILTPTLTSAEQAQKYLERLKYEIGVIKKLGFVKYFLMVDDIIRYARSIGIMVGPARGSAAGSLICYLMGITQVDPLVHGLIFERFLNPERIDLPDIDVDFQDDRREEVFEYIRTKYGYEYTANINTVGMLSMSSAFRDVARTFGIDNFKINHLSKQIEDADSFDSVPDLVKFRKANKDNANIVEQAKKLVGTIRQQGVHACGYIVSSHKLKNVSVIEKRKGVNVVNWDMRLCESFGLLKVDVLSLSTLTILSKAAKLIKEQHSVDIDFPKIPLDDKKTLDAFSRGEGIGVFQFENAGMQALLKALKANTFETITDTTALFRPGSLESGETEKYAQVTQGHRYEEYVCEQIRPILEPTKGVMVYQEQIMAIFVELGGFTWAEADKMRKIVSKSLGKEQFNKNKAHFVQGCKTNGIDEFISETLFSKMAEFAAYSFNKSHAVAYTMISFWTMYIKVRYPVEFFAANLTHSSGDNVTEIVKDAKRLGVTIKNPDINLSTEEYTISDYEKKTIVAPIGIIKGVGDKCVESVLKGRADKVFMSLEDFRERVEKRTCNIRHFGILKRAGAFESLGWREPDPEMREKNFAELLPIHDSVPTMDKTSHKLEMDMINHHYKDIQFCSKEDQRRVMMPQTGAKPFIVVVNNPVKGELEHLTNKGTKYFLTEVKKYGLNPSNFYYTSPVKCFHAKGTKPTKECQGKCADFLKREIQIVNPKLIICFATDILGMFIGGRKPTMGKLNGQITYNKEYDCYVLFSYSPQYAYFSEEKAGPKFKESMRKLAEIFSNNLKNHAA